MAEYIDLSQPTLYFSVATILFNPIFWNIVARAEYRSHVLTKLAGGNPYHGCYALAVTIFSLGIFRDFVYKTALENQPTHPLLQTNIALALAAVFFVVGNVLVLTSMWALGVTGTYLGDYFGILMDSRVTGFPFNLYGKGAILDMNDDRDANPRYGSPAGIALTAIVFVCYQIALTYEGPFTAMIYEKKSKQK
ncbi:Phosphatidyl-N-methylethanolamine N-methyltransferase [Apophysomyces ossiformis]|uniref:Phosphatidyl-N-methylethanolamine N-methyltransferase n=1 Tax=Apophysomyces ossiformis TaxID=679940 RepID=A0A8H7BI80_9FUNG|nr:Phosphatidyl-N-methylethanolamine N-methyltransferase [Apophysomyces ossiformis]